MGWIDVAIPGVAGLLAAFCPHLFVKQCDDASEDQARVTKIRNCGLLLLGVAALYCLIKFAS